MYAFLLFSTLVAAFLYDKLDPHRIIFKLITNRIKSKCMNEKKKNKQMKKMQKIIKK